MSATFVPTRKLKARRTDVGNEKGLTAAYFGSSHNSADLISFSFACQWRYFGPNVHCQWGFVDIFCLGTWKLLMIVVNRCGLFQEFFVQIRLIK